MCSIAAVGTGLTIANGISTAVQLSQRNRLAIQEEQAANRAYALDIDALRERARQISQQAQLDEFERERQALRERAKLLVSAGEAGVGGNSVLRQFNQSFVDAAIDEGIIKENLENSLAQNELQAQGIAATRSSRINRARSQRVSPFLGALTIGSNVASSYFSIPKPGG